jgi:flagellar export protein FliJ
MRAFSFRLQVVLDRALEEEEAEVRRLGTLQHALAALETRMREVMAQRREEARGLAALQCEACDPHALHERYLFLDALAARLAEMDEERTRQQQAITAQRERVAAAMRKRQTLEKLKDKARAEYQHAFQLAELQAMEECVLPRLARAKMDAAIAPESLT